VIILERLMAKKPVIIKRQRQLLYEQQSVGFHYQFCFSLNIEVVPVYFKRDDYKK